MINHYELKDDNNSSNNNLIRVNYKCNNNKHNIIDNPISKI